MFDTIAALATPPARSAIGVIRVSGPEAGAVLGRIFRARHPKKGGPEPRRVVFGDMCDASGARLDEGLAVFFPGPGSYTGEDSAELYCHGSPGVLSGMLRAAYAAGARPAQPGEFTKRAFLNGRLDLTQAEAVIDLIDSESEQAAKNALAQLAGALGRRIAAARGRLVELAAHFCAALDFPEDDLPPLLMPEAEKTLRDIAEELEALLRTHEQGACLRDGVPCAIVGRPNSGKSSLLNALSGFDRSIVTEVAGTTRDVVEQGVRIGGVRLRLQDTAGLRETADPVERIGVGRSRDAARDAGLVLAVFDGSVPWGPEDALVLELADGRGALCVVNKADLPPALDEGPLKARFPELLHVSAVTGEGLDALREAVAARAPQVSADFDGGIVTNPRQADALSRALACVRAAGEAAASGVTPDAVLSDIEASAAVLGELTGETVSEDVLRAIFSRFCIGK